MQTVKTFRDPWDAYLFRTRLAADGIPAFVANDLHVWNNWPISTALGGVRVQVPNGYEDQADETLRRCRDGEYESDLAAMFGPLDDRQCPRCGSEDVRVRPTLRELILGLLLGVFVCNKISTSRCTCRVCGTRWIDGRYEK